MLQRSVPPSVRRAVLSGDKTALSRLGKRGAARRIERKDLEKSRRDSRIVEAEETAVQAHEDICPVDD